MIIADCIALADLRMRYLTEDTLARTAFPIWPTVPMLPSRGHRLAAALYTALRSRLPTATTTTINWGSRTSYTKR